MASAKLGVLFMASVIALAGIGAGLAMWYDEITITGIIKTGSADIEIINYSGTWVWKLIGPDAPENQTWVTHDKNWNPYSMFPVLTDAFIVSWAEARDPVGQETGDAVIEFNNTFPCENFMADVVFNVSGTIPLRVQDVDFTWDGDNISIPGGPPDIDFIDWLMMNGHMGGGLWKWNESAQDWTDPVEAGTVGTQLHSGDLVKLIVWIHLPQDILVDTDDDDYVMTDFLMDLSGSGSVYIKVVQWNEWVSH